MAISQANRKELDIILKDYFANNRTSTAFEIVEMLQEENTGLFTILKDASVKMDEESYLARYILPKLKKEGWLALIDDQWKVQLSPERCSCCFKLLDQIYVIDIDLNRYCGWNCTERCHYYAEPYESNLDMYSFLFDRFETLLPECLLYNKNTHFSHQAVPTKLNETILEVESVVRDSHYDDIRYTKGKESCVDTEIYRMLIILDLQCERLNSLLTRATNIGVCIKCLIALDVNYIVNQYGESFCSENCLENYCETHATEYSPHPYEDQYLSIRREYINLLEYWESRLSSKETYLESRIDELYEEINEIITDYYDFVLSEGDDGVYAREIYQYTKKLEGLQQTIFAWRPNRITYYWVSSGLGKYGSDDDNFFDKITAELYLDGYGEDILKIIKNYPHPYHCGCNFVFNRYEDALEVFDVLKPYYDKYEQDISLEEAHKCEAGCGDIVSKSDDNLFVNGFFYCYSHSESREYGIYSEADLNTELKNVSENDSQRQAIIEDKHEWCYPFREMIKRSCRTHRLEIPDWAKN